MTGIDITRRGRYRTQSSVLLIVAVGNRSLIGCFLAESPLCCACDTTCVTSFFFFWFFFPRPLPSLLIFWCSEFLDLPVKASVIKQTRTTACCDCPEVVWICSQLSKQKKHETKKKNKKQAHYQRGVADESLFNNSHSCASCFYSRRLRPQTPQRSDDEGGNSTLAVPQLCVSLQAKEDLSWFIHPLQVEQISRRSDHHFSSRDAREEPC